LTLQNNDKNPPFTTQRGQQKHTLHKTDCFKVSCQTYTMRENNLVKDNTNSIEVTKNSKGYGWSIKVYDNDHLKAIDKLLEINSSLKERFE